MINAGLTIDFRTSRTRARPASDFSEPNCSSWSRPLCRAPVNNSSLSRGSRCRGQETGHVPHARYRRRQGAAVHANIDEENPALGWRAIRLGLDRPGLLRSQVRALLRAASGRSLKLMFPMIAVVEEFDRAKSLVEVELTYLRRHGTNCPNVSRSARWSRSHRSCSSSTNCFNGSISFPSGPTTSSISVCGRPGQSAGIGKISTPFRAGACAR